MPFRAPDPHNLRAAATSASASIPAPIIEVDRFCMGCGYNLRGLRAGINCPECGMPSVMPKGIDNPLAEMPRRVIIAFIWGSWTGSISVVGAIAAVIAGRLPQLDPIIPLLTFCGVSLLWLVAVWMLTPAFSIPQAVFYGFGRANPLRKWTRLLQSGWIVAIGCSIALRQMPGAATMLTLTLTWCARLGIVAGVAGVVLLCLLMEKLADWTRDEEAQNKFNWTAWGLPFATLMLFANITQPVLATLITLLWFALACLFPWAMLSLCKSVTLSIAHSYEHEGRSQRREERNQKYQRYVGDLVDKMDRK